MRGSEMLEGVGGSNGEHGSLKRTGRTFYFILTWINTAETLQMRRSLSYSCLISPLEAPPQVL